MDIISKIVETVKSWVVHYQRDILLAICMVLVAGIGYNLGTINALHGTSSNSNKEASLYQPAVSATSKKAAAIMPSKPPTDLRVVASKGSSSKLYHYTWCPGAKQIKESNKLWFNTAAAADAAGYTLAGNCK